MPAKLGARRGHVHLLSPNMTEPATGSFADLKDLEDVFAVLSAPTVPLQKKPLIDRGGVVQCPHHKSQLLGTESPADPEGRTYR